LDLLFNIQRSVGYISETLQEMGAAAAAYNAQVRIPLPVLGEVDEIFQGRKPCLTVVDGHSFLVLNLSAPKVVEENRASRDSVQCFRDRWGIQE
jgi:hypothetical protein